MVILCAPDSFKGTLAAPEAAAAMARGVQRARSGTRTDHCPVADGGEGTLRVLSAGIGAQLETTTVLGPLGEPVEAGFGVQERSGLGIVAFSEASGPNGRVMDATSYGTGQLIAAALDRGASEVLVCLGGSGTVDGAAGLAQALGATFVDAKTPVTARDLRSITAWSEPWRTPRLRAACDVTNPLLGPDGAAAVYGPQKGATPEQVVELEEGLAHLASIVGGDTTQPGAGAAGGAGWGLAAMLGAQLCRGIDLVLEVLDFDTRCREADLVITGEGSLDRQTLSGKACAGVAAVAHTHGVPVVAIAGRVEPDPRLEQMFDRIVSLTDLYGDRAVSEPEWALAEAAAQILTD